MIPPIAKPLPNPLNSRGGTLFDQPLKGFKLGLPNGGVLS